jgi:hypothetical protein
MSVYDEIKAERDYQNGKWGTLSDDNENTPWMWASYIAQYATRWMRGAFVINRDDTVKFRESMIKTAAIAIAAVESLDRQQEESGKAFYEV